MNTSIAPIRNTKQVEVERVAIQDAESPMLRALASSLSDEFLEQYPPLTPNQLVRLERSLKSSVKRGMQSVGTMVCKGGECVLADSCPLESAGVPPLGLHCPIETMYMEQMRTLLMEEFSIKPENISWQIRLNDLISTLIIERRAAAGLSQEELLENVATMVTVSGDIITTRKESPYLAIIERCDKRKAALMKEFLATPEAKAKYNNEKESEAAISGARIMDTIKKIQAKAQENIIDEAIEVKG